MPLNRYITKCCGHFQKILVPILSFPEGELVDSVANLCSSLPEILAFQRVLAVCSSSLHSTKTGEVPLLA